MSVETEVQSEDVLVTWEATDGGADLQTCTLAVRDGEGPWQPLSANCAGTYIYGGEPGHLYTFRLTATDNVGNSTGTEAQAGVPRVTKYYYAAEQRIAMRTPDGVYYLHTDHLGSVSLATDGTGAEVPGSRVRYLPFGAPRGGNEPPIAGLTDFAFNGQRWDASIGLYYYHARYYHPALGRFISADTLVPEPGNPQDLNRYAYVRNNPLAYTDPTGHGVVPPSALKIDISEWNKWAVGALRAALFVLGAQTSMEEDTLKVEPSTTIPCGADFIVAAPAAAAASRLADVADDAAAQLAPEEVLRNPLPTNRTFARVVPERYGRLLEQGADITLTSPVNEDVFITAADDLVGISTSEGIAQRLTLVNEAGELVIENRAVVEFEMRSLEGIASPVFRSNPGFVGRGLTAGGAREWVIPNRPISELPIIIKRIWYAR